MTTQELQKAKTLKTIDRLIKDLDDYFDDLMDLNPPDEEENYMAGDASSVCREAMARLREIVIEYK